MLRINTNYLELQGSYLFSTIAKKVNAYKAAHPEADIIRMGIGDVTQPLLACAARAMTQAVQEMQQPGGFHGYGPEQGYDFLRDAIAQGDYAARGIAVEPDEIFVSDGAKCDTGNFQELFAPDCKIAVTDPVYPVYVDSNVMAGRAGAFCPDAGRYAGLAYLPCTAEDGFVPALPSQPVDVIYLCYPNNPTGTTLTRDQLKVWVDYALDNRALLLYDGAYEAFVADPEVPRSIYEIPGARQVAVEFRSFSKTAGFTGVRCAYTVVPKELTLADGNGNPVALHGLWNRRQTTKFNGVSYITQRGAAAIYTPEGQKEVKERIAYYMQNAARLREALCAAGMRVYGGVNAPYVWVKTPEGMTSWQYFDWLLEEKRIVGTPGAGFGRSGEGYFRFTAFATAEDTRRAVERLG